MAEVESALSEVTNRRERRQADRLRDRWIRGVAQDPRVDDETFRTLAYLAQYADANGEVTIDNEDGTDRDRPARVP